MLDVPLIIWFYALAIVGSLGMTIRSVTAGRPSYGTGVLSRDRNVVEITLDRSGTDRLKRGMRTLSSTIIRRVAPETTLASANHRIARAGLSHKFTPDRWLAGKASAGVAVFVPMFILGMVTSSATTLLLGAVGGVLLFFVPELYLSSRGDSRGKKMQRDLADAVDQILISVEAGASLDMALRRVAQGGDGPLCEELSRTLQDISLGMGRYDALMSLADRTDVPDLRELIVSLARSEELGLSVGRVLRVQSEEIRDRRRMRAEEAAMKVPVKMVLPLVLNIMPALLAVIMGPAAVRISQDILS